MFKKIIYILLVIIFTFALFGCGASKPAAPAGEGEAASGDVSIKVTGKVDNEKTWTEDEIKGMKTMEAERANKEGVMETYTGVSINELLNEAGVQGDASKVFMVADDGYEAEVALADLQACGNCIVSFITQGGFNSVLPDFPNNVQVKGIVELRVE
jgi:hypothetical protein